MTIRSLLTCGLSGEEFDTSNPQPIENCPRTYDLRQSLHQRQHLQKPGATYDFFAHQGEHHSKN